MFKRFIAWVKYHFSQEWCYDRMERDGTAAMGCCCGVVGGTSATDHLSEMCVGCPHWVSVNTESPKATTQQ